MKTKKVYIPILIIGIYLTCGCNKRDYENQGVSFLVSNFNENNWEAKIFYQNNTKHEFLFLDDDNDDNIIGDITNLKLFDDYILFYERARDLLFLFSINEDFMTKIGKKGRGPNEYTRITYYDFSTKNGEPVIEILDANRYEFQTYNLSGELISVTKLNQDLSYMSFVHTESGYFFFTPENKDKYMLVLFSNNLKEIKERYLYDNSIFIPSEDQHFIKTDDKIFFHYGYNDTIYSIDGTDVQPSIYIDFGERKVVNSDVLNTKSLKEYQNKLYFSNKTFLGNIKNMMSNGNRIIFNFGEIKINEPTQSYYGDID
ncbi:MAG: 6-bladed beta-propeller, partial [Bacteroidales bacterium]|nr:6-bladed beta-propeller [Bacteroidales bacterium]